MSYFLHEFRFRTGSRQAKLSTCVRLRLLLRKSFELAGVNVIKAQNFTKHV